MANIVFPDGSSPLFNPAGYGEVAKEANKARTSRSRSGAAAEKPKKKLFASLFEKAASGEIREMPPSEDSVHLLLDGVHDAGDALSKRPFPPEIRAYKEAVRNFVHYVVENAYDTEEHISGANLIKRKKFTLVQVIDKKLEEMASAILRGQMNQFLILAKVEEIKGLLVDLME